MAGSDRVETGEHNIQIRIRRSVKAQCLRSQKRVSEDRSYPPLRLRIPFRKHENKQHDSNDCEIAKGGFLTVPRV
jgi:hypothetical protein